MPTSNRQRIVLLLLCSSAAGLGWYLWPGAAGPAATQPNTDRRPAAARTTSVPSGSPQPLGPAPPHVPVANPQVSTSNERIIAAKEVDPEEERKDRAEQELTYRIRRLRFDLNDAAASCYGGAPSKDAITLVYTLVVENEALRVENVRVRENTIRDIDVQDCLMSAVRDLRSIAPLVGDLRQEQTSTISLSDLADRNRRNDKSDP